ncbi:hypothetical protein OGAPHI_001039 [Ogataea philodendri]|uniref:Secreted protein n=1 Tax=Ogataea philodendri TaxID=1378263 RepID=A0A9P8PFI4_9ASCO|nr:uncharacterized protein OGAPHI_001039 [Ogataea philodendri]KAH3670524.1 hypothetical protein OGAPHI_001039 [Ogataea philodendri]
MWVSILALTSSIVRKTSCIVLLIAPDTCDCTISDRSRCTESSELSSEDMRYSMALNVDRSSMGASSVVVFVYDSLSESTPKSLAFRDI